MVEWANEHFYLSAESSYIQGKWDTLVYQVAPMNAIGCEDIREVNFVKSARVGYSQMIRAALGYFVEHKSRNQLLFQPTDSAAGNFMKAHVETMIRDVPVVKVLAPWIGKKHRDSTMDAKRFTNGKQLWCLGGTSARNYREKSVDVVYYDELSGFDGDIEKEGDPITLGDKRIEGSVFPKSVRGSTPKMLDTCQITKAASNADCYFRFHLPCPHCKREAYLKWGGKDSEFGFKWDQDQPSTVHYLCEYCGALSTQLQMYDQHAAGRWVCDLTGYWTRDGVHYYDGNTLISTPSSVAFHIWTAYSPFTTWTQIVKDWLKIKGDQGKLKTFINTTLGETWDENAGEQVEYSAIHSRREHYLAEVPVDACVLTAAVDVQDDHLELQVVAWALGEESYAISYERLFGDLSRPEIWDLLAERINRPFATPSGTLVNVRMAAIDSGGHFTDQVYALCRKHGRTRFVPIKGASVPGKPIAVFPRQRTKSGVHLTILGTDTAKEMLVSRMLRLEPGIGYMHFPINDQFDETYFINLTNERRTTKYVKGRKVVVWDAGKRRNEPFDLWVYNLAAIRILQQSFGVNLARTPPLVLFKQPPTTGTVEDVGVKPRRAPQRGLNTDSW